MFLPSTYTERRRTLVDTLRPTSGVVLLLGNEQCAMNAADNPYPFRQDSTFLYYFGLDAPGLDGLIDLDEGTARLYGNDPSLDEVVWQGERPSLRERAQRAGVTETAPRADLADDLTTAVEQGRTVHLIPPYRDAHYRRLETLLGLRPARIDAHVSAPLVDAVIAQRSVKSDDEIEELERALNTTARMHEAALERAAPGRTEREVAGRLAGLAEAHGRGLSFRPTCSVRGEVLHNHEYDNVLESGDLLLVDAGATSPKHYAGDITRVVPVGGAVTGRQRRIYEAVLAAQEAAREALAPDRPFVDVHRTAARVLTEHLIDMGLMHGPAADAVAAGAHALFFPHGLGHMLGLDVHDMEALGEDRVGYAPDQSRSDQFGLHTLRLARPLEPGFVVTVEPGCYFIPALIEQWCEQSKHADFIDYDAVAAFEDFGGIRIEDDVVITDDGARVLGPAIPKAVADIESRAGVAA